jgi:hypothetical protein
MEEIAYDPGPPLIILFVITWPIYALPGLITLPALFWREKALPWTLPDIPVAILPWFIWMFIFKSTEDADKKLQYAIIECFVMGCTVPAGLSAVIMLRGRANPYLVRVGILITAGLLAMALCTYVFRIAD